MAFRLDHKRICSLENLTNFLNDRILLDRRRERESERLELILRKVLHTRACSRTRAANLITIDTESVQR
jgi:hypothetical protein